MKDLFYRSIQVIIALLSVMVMLPLRAQENKMDITGVYYLSGVMETAAVFELKRDSSFEFFFSQGALDRGGTGMWTVKDGRIVFNSTHARPPADYTLVNSKTIPGNYTIVKMVNKNTMILSYSDVTLKTSSGNLTAGTNSDGEVKFPKKNATEIAILFRLCPDRQSVFTVNPKHNYFEFRLESWVAEVFFQNFSLKLNDAELFGMNPVLDGDQFRYKKEK